MRRWIIGIALGCAATLILAAALGWIALRASMPSLDGRLEAPVDSTITLARDARGAVTVTATSDADLAFGLGYAHGQDRFFQMDLARRLAAGELAELIGAVALPHDRDARVFRFRAVAAQVLQDAAAADREVLDAYARGVNAGLASARGRPWEYWMLRASPHPWRAADSVLVVHSMWWQLQHEELGREQRRRALHGRWIAALAAAGGGEGVGTQADAIMRFLYARGNSWDAPNFATLAEAGSTTPSDPDLPLPEVLDLRRLLASGPLMEATTGGAPDAQVTPQPRPPEGSNNWAVAGRRTRSGAALVANDMHLGLAVPIVWYVAQLKRSGGAQPGSSLVGVSLPGVPGIVAGSNGRIAWGFTNSYGDYSDVTPVSCDPAAQTYVTDSGLRQFVVKEERIRVKGGSDERLLVRDSPLGVLIATSEDGRTCWLARWLAVERGATNFTLHSLAEAASVEDAVALAADVGMPHQNLVVGDRSGRIAWSLIGRLPAGDLGPSAARPLVWRAAGTQPAIVDPELGILVTANARPVEGEAEILIGNDEAGSGMSYDNGARAGQIRGGLLALDRPAEAQDMLRIQLDDRALFLARWRNLLLGLLDEEALRNQPRRAELRRLVVLGSGRAAIDSAAYRLVRGFRITTQSAVWNMFTAAAGMAPDSVEIPTMFEGALWRLVTEQPPHLLDARHRDWRGFLLAQVDALIEELRGACGSLDRCVWGQRNAVSLRHPLSPALPFLRWLIDLPQRPLPGDENMPRVQVGAFGASQRFAVAPGFETRGYLQIAGGQSGHPLSRYYESYYEDWAAGSTTPLLPGRSEHLVTFVSATSTRKP